MDRILAILGTVLTVVFGMWGVFLALRTRYPGRIAVYLADAIQLFEGVVKSVPDLQVSFRGQPIDPGIVLLKLIVVNDGYVDIDPSIVADPLTFRLPQEYDWLAARVIATSPGVSATANLGSHTVQLHTGLFRRREYIHLDLLVQVPHTDLTPKAPASAQLRKAMQLTHRIRDTSAARVVELPSDVENATFRRFIVATFVSCVLMAAFSGITWRNARIERLEAQRRLEKNGALAHQLAVIAAVLKGERHTPSNAMSAVYGISGETESLYAVAVVIMSLGALFFGTVCGYNYVWRRRLQRIQRVATVGICQRSPYFPPGRSVKNPPSGCRLLDV